MRSTGLGPAEQADLPGANRRDEDRAGHRRFDKALFRFLGNRRSSRQPDHRAGVEQDGRRGGVILLAQNNEWAVQRSRYLSLESVASLSDSPIVNLPIMAA